ncbi:Phosphomevalonate kinase [Rhodotorula diobovata]|uniref:Phosphomevalonate kinase n=1 Tax=Rhodotorula diobovata TaxID=5288 RepID=A0A5C5FXI9_9BASI|nr:Phosphomevalonate kinase [Rhodotorula diobovata]
MAAQTNGVAPTSTVVSCPGKVFLAGGYLVLDRQHQGFVVATPSRFFTVVKEAPHHAPGAPAQGAGEEDRFEVAVVSPQFDDGRWRYEARRVQGEWLVEEQKQEGLASNSFVLLSVRAALQVASAVKPSASFRSLEVTIVGSNDFYSQSRTGTPIPFAPLNCTIRDVHKTGLGSSAAMVTSLTSALVLHWTGAAGGAEAPSQGRLPNPDDETIQLLHNLAQYVHSLAQGKVGSGFDVSTAIYGSQTYRRFAVECLGELLNPDSSNDSTITSQDLLTALSPSLNPAWTAPSTAGSVSSFSLPPHTLLLLADVDAGSNTPSMVGKVLAWKKANPDEAERVWAELGRSNGKLRDSFAALTARAAEDPSAYEAEAARLAGLPASEWASSSVPFADAVSDILTIRKHIRYMGEASGVPIEPPEQTNLLDACSALPGVIGGGVPGAGGYDAIWVLCLDPSSRPSPASSPAPVPAPADAVEALLRSYTAMSVGPLSRTAWAKGGTVEGEKGLLRERLDEVEGLREAVARGEAAQ